jgi:hypothetical protein
MTRTAQRSAGPAAPPRGEGRRDAALERKLKRNGLVLGLLALAFYVGYLAWNFLRGPL